MADSDNILFLFSSDWFLASRLVQPVFLGISDAGVASIGSSAKGEVAKILDGQDSYWNVSFSPERISRSLEIFLGDCKSRLKVADWKRFEGQICPMFLLVDSDFEAFFAASMTLQVLAGDLAEGSNSEVMQVIRDTVSEQISIKNDNHLNQTKWDAWLRTKFAGQDEYVVDFFFGTASGYFLVESVRRKFESLGSTKRSQNDFWCWVRNQSAELGLPPFSIEKISSDKIQGSSRDGR